MRISRGFPYWASGGREPSERRCSRRARAKGRRRRPPHPPTTHLTHNTRRALWARRGCGWCCGCGRVWGLGFGEALWLVLWAGGAAAGVREAEDKASREALRLVLWVREEAERQGGCRRRPERVGRPRRRSRRMGCATQRLVQRTSYLNVSVSGRVCVCVILIGRWLEGAPGQA